VTVFSDTKADAVYANCWPVAIDVMDKDGKMVEGSSVSA
jgi:hypothetical protein